MRDTMEIGSTPAEEACAQVGAKRYDYASVARMECRAFINQIRRELGPEPEGAALRVKSNPHDYGTYYEVAVSYDYAHPEAVDYAFRCEEVLSTWDAAAREELTAAGYPWDLL